MVVLAENVVVVVIFTAVPTAKLSVTAVSYQPRNTKLALVAAAKLSAVNDPP